MMGKSTQSNDPKHLKEWTKECLISFNPVKTKVMLISNIFCDDILHLYFDDNPLNIVEIHKHLSI